MVTHSLTHTARRWVCTCHGESCGSHRLCPHLPPPRSLAAAALHTDAAGVGALLIPGAQGAGNDEVVCVRFIS